MFSLREQLEAAFQEDDRCRLEHEQFERKWAKRLEVQKRSAGSELVYQMHEPQQQSSFVMDQATQDAWNRWLADYVKRELQANNDMLVDAIVEFVGEYVARHLKSVREEIGSLRADITVQAGIARGEIAELKGNVPVKRGKDAA